MLRLGIDLGGTKIEGVILDEGGQTLFRDRIATEQEKGYDHILDRIRELYLRMLSEICSATHTLGIGTPGAFSKKTGKLKNSNTVCLNGCLDRDALETLARHAVSVENDANCFALAEATLGAGRGKQLVFGVILGTGCGGGIVMQGQILKGPQAIAGEWGHMTIDPAGPLCYCGARGCVETFISGGGLAQRAAETFGDARPFEEIMQKYREGDKAMVPFVETFFENFGRALANVINVLDPDLVVLGGGVSNIPELYEQGIAAVGKYVFSDEMTTEIVRHELGDSAGVLGAALLGAG